MVDFNKKIYNTLKFNCAARFFKEHGCYTLAPRGTTDYNNYWDRETERCLNGYVADDGDYITGYHYFYLNYSPIIKRVDTTYTDRLGNTRIRRERIFDFPAAWDGDFYFFNAVEEAELQGKHLAVLKARKKGFSFKASSMLVRNYTLIEKSKNFAIASEQKFLVGDGLLTKAWEIMDFIDKNTDWSKRRLTSTRMERVSGFKVKDEFGKETEQGYMSTIQGITLKNDPERLRGTRGKLMIFEEGGKFPNLETAWRVAQPSMEDDDGQAFGLMLVMGTGGTEGGSFDGLKLMFYNPKAFNILAFPNIWDDNAENTLCSYFSPMYLNMEGYDKDGNYKFMDKDGNSLKEKAIENLIEQRNQVKDGGATQLSIDRFISERPIKPLEACLELGKNIFPRKLLMDLLTRIRTNTKLKNMKHIVDLAWDGNGMVKATEKKSGDITTYHLKKDDKPEGSVVIWEYPINDPPFGLYIAGCLTPGEKVQTQRGLVNVEEVGLGDKLLNKDGEFVEIKNLQRYLKEDEHIYKVKLSNTYRTTTFTGEHPLFLAKDYNDKFDFVRAKNAEVGMYARIPNTYKSRYSNDFGKQQDFYWFIGLWLGDGWASENGRISIAFDAEQPSYYEKYKDVVKSQFNRSVSCRIRGGLIEASFTHAKLATWLTDTFGKGASNKHIPDHIKRISKQNLIALLLGYLDSDGAVCNNKHCGCSIEYVSINQELLEDVQDLCFAVGVVGSITRLRPARVGVIQGRRVSQKECFHLRIGLKDTLKLGQMFLKINSEDEKINRIDFTKVIANHSKRNCFLSDDELYIYFKITSIETSLYSGVVYNFECETHTFMCRNILTHNCDPYDHDESFTNSLGSTFIFKRVRAGEAWNDVIVAEYSGRPDTAEEYYENVRKLLVFYNARLLFENERKGIYPYFTNKHCDYLLADQPDKIITEVFKDSKVQRRKGCHMTKQIRAYGEGLILEWLMDEYEPGHPNIERIYSEPLLEELIENDGVKNVDRLIALCMVMIYREELYLVKVAAAKEQNKQVELFEIPLFSLRYWDAEESQDDIPLFSF